MTLNTDDPDMFRTSLGRANTRSRRKCSDSVRPSCASWRRIRFARRFCRKRRSASSWRSSKGKSQPRIYTDFTDRTRMQIRLSLIRVIRVNPWSNCFCFDRERTMPKHIGIVACSAEGAALCYRTICDEAPALMGRHMHPEISHAHPLPRRVHGAHLPRRLAGRRRPDAVVGRTSWRRPARTFSSRPTTPFITRSIWSRRARRCPGCTSSTKLPLWPSRAAIRKLAITGTKYTMEGTVYQTKLPAAASSILCPMPTSAPASTPSSSMSW